MDKKEIVKMHNLLKSKGWAVVINKYKMSKDSLRDLMLQHGLDTSMGTCLNMNLTVRSLQARELLSRAWV
jgi:hypothetical protein